MEIKKAAKNLSLLISGIILALVLAEATFHLVPSVGERYALKNFVQKSFWDNCDSSGWRPSKLLGYERIPNSVPNINSYGLIGEEFDINKDKNVFRILILGDSIIAQNYFVEHLKEMLNNQPSEIKFELINAGVPAYNIWQNANFLKYKGIEFNPDMVILSFCLGSFSERDMIFYTTKKKLKVLSVPASRVLKLTSVNVPLFSRSYLYRFAILTLETILGHGKDYTRRDAGIHYVGLMKEICDNRRISFFGFIWPYLMPREEYENWMEHQYSTVLEVLDYLKIDYIDLHEHFPKKKIKNLRDPECDYVHPSNEGHRIAAMVIFRHLLDNHRSW